MLVIRWPDLDLFVILCEYIFSNIFLVLRYLHLVLCSGHFGLLQFPSVNISFPHFLQYSIGIHVLQFLDFFPDPTISQFFALFLYSFLSSYLFVLYFIFFIRCFSQFSIKSSYTFSVFFPLFTPRSMSYLALV